MSDQINPSQAITYTRLSARALHDPRFHTSRLLREFVLTSLYLVHVKGFYGRTFAEACTILGVEPRTILRDDAPRYEPPESFRVCAGTNRSGRCKTRPITSDPEKSTDPATGRWKVIFFCSRHQGQRVEHQRRETAGKPFPRPLPNRGGLLAAYLPLNTESLTRHYREVLGNRWDPEPHGVNADLWTDVDPVPQPRSYRPGHLTIVR